MDSLSQGPIVQFYIGEIAHPQGYHIQDIWGWDNDQLEKRKDYIAWLFPSDDRQQKFNNAPILTDRDISEFKENAELKERFIKSFRLILGFYGLELKESNEGIKIDPSTNYSERISKWVTKNSHNYRRISRILRSLSILGCKSYSEEFLNALRNIYSKNTNKMDYIILKHWRYAGIDLNKNKPVRRFEA